MEDAGEACVCVRVRVCVCFQILTPCQFVLQWAFATRQLRTQNGSAAYSCWGAIRPSSIFS